MAEPLERLTWHMFNNPAYYLFHQIILVMSVSSVKNTDFQWSDVILTTQPARPHQNIVITNNKINDRISQIYT